MRQQSWMIGSYPSEIFLYRSVGRRDASQSLPKASPKLPKASPKPPQSLPKPPQSLPRASPDLRTTPQSLPEDPRAKNGNSAKIHPEW